MKSVVGYKLVSIKGGKTVQEWGGTWGQMPAFPNPFRLPNGDYVHAGKVGETYGGFRIEEWVMEEPAPTPEQVNIERDRRIGSGFLFAGNRFQSRREDMENIAFYGALAAIAIMGGAQRGDYKWRGGKEDVFWILADNSRIRLDAYDASDMAGAAASWKSMHIFAGRAIKDMPEIPRDYQADRYWP